MERQLKSVTKKLAAVDTQLAQLKEDDAASDTSDSESEVEENSH